MPNKKEFAKERERLNKLILDNSGIEIKRFFNLDTIIYKDGKLSARIKEMLGLVASLVLRCDDCIKYHLLQCKDRNLSTEEIQEIFSVGLIVGGSITIPHIRKAFEFWLDLND